MKMKPNHDRTAKHLCIKKPTVKLEVGVSHKQHDVNCVLKECECCWDMLQQSQWPPLVATCGHTWAHLGLITISPTSQNNTQYDINRNKPENQRILIQIQRTTQENCFILMKTFCKACIDCNHELWAPPAGKGFLVYFHHRKIRHCVFKINVCDLSIVFVIRKKWVTIFCHILCCRCTSTSIPHSFIHAELLNWIHQIARNFSYVFFWFCFFRICGFVGLRFFYNTAVKYRSLPLL